jgi:NTE family protein
MRAHIALLLLLSLATPETLAQPLRVGLALSGGGAKGLAHIGVLKVLDEAGVQVDCISGTSMGSVVGGLYAMGYSGVEIEAMLADLDWNALLYDVRDRPLLTMAQKQLDGQYTLTLPIVDGTVGLPAGIIFGQNMELLISRLTAPAHSIRNFTELPSRFVCIATDVATGEVVRLEQGDFGDAIRASTALPLAFTPVPRDGRLLVDGGLVRNFPVEDVRSLGTDFVIGVDIGSSSLRTPQIRNFVQVVSQALTFSDEAERARQRSLCDILLTPDISDLSLLDFEDPHAIIRRGEEAARKVLSSLDSLARVQRSQSHPLRRRLPPPADSVQVRHIVLEADSTLERSTLLRELGIRPPVRLSLRQIDEAVDRLGSLEIFETVSYRLPGGPGSDTLLIRTRGTRNAFLRLGLRYDTYGQAAMILSATFAHLGKDFATGTVDLRLGDQWFVDLAYAYPIGIAPGFGLRLDLALKENLIPSFRERLMTSELNVRSAIADLSLGSWYSRALLVSGGVRGEYAELSPSIAEEDFLLVERFLALHGLAHIDNLDRPFLPRRGTMITAGVDGTFPSLSSRGPFLRWYGLARGILPLTPRLSASAGLFAAQGTGDGLPSHYVVSLGGLRTPALLPYDRMVRTSFIGLQQQELIGRQAYSLTLALQAELSASFVLALQASAGRADDAGEIRLAGQQYASGIGVTASYLSFLGPMEFTLMTGSLHRLLAYVSIGADF